MERRHGDFKMTAGHKRREYAWGIFFKLHFAGHFQVYVPALSPGALEKTGGGREGSGGFDGIIQGSGKTVSIQDHCSFLVSNHLSPRSRSSVCLQQDTCPFLPTNATAPLAKCCCAAELRSQGEEVKDKTVHCRISL